MSLNQLKYKRNYPQSFTGKERDSETGFSYFGARYYDSDLMTSWLSVDPMADKYPGLSPYAYCANNPVKLVDPDGRMISDGDYFDQNGKYLGSDSRKDAKVYILNENQTIIQSDNFNSENTQQKFTEITKDNDLYSMFSAVYAEMAGGSIEAKQIVAESIYNRSKLPDKSYEKADGTYKGIISKAYDVAKKGNKRYECYKNPQNYIYKNSQEHNAWIESVSVSIVANNGESNLGNGVIFYHSNSETFFNKYSMCEKINLPQSMRGIKGIWKLKSQK